MRPVPLLPVLCVLVGEISWGWSLLLGLVGGWRSLWLSKLEFEGWGVPPPISLFLLNLHLVLGTRGPLPNLLDIPSTGACGCESPPPDGVEFEEFWSENISEKA